MARFCDSNQKRGVTLVELIVVLVILAVLAALLVPSLTGYIDKAVEKRIMLQARSLMTAAQATIDEAYAKGELHIDNYGGFEQPNEDTAHKLAKQIIELSELEGEQYTWRFQLVDPATLNFPLPKSPFWSLPMASTELCIASAHTRRSPPVGAAFRKFQRSQNGARVQMAIHSFLPLTMILIDIIHSLA